jgi:hypothetical protein
MAIPDRSDVILCLSGLHTFEAYKSPDISIHTLLPSFHHPSPGNLPTPSHRTPHPSIMDTQSIYSQVQSHYSSLARTTDTSYSSAIAQAFGYTEEQLNSIPRDANLGLSCGNPLAIASLREVSLM